MKCYNATGGRGTVILVLEGEEQILSGWMERKYIMLLEGEEQLYSDWRQRKFIMILRRGSVTMGLLGEEQL